MDGDPLTALLVSTTTHGTLTLSNNGAFIYRPNTNYNGTDTFTYRATDGSLTSGVATVMITINPVNDAPVANNDAYTTLEDTTLTVLTGGVLANDIDVDGDVLTALLVSSTTHGTLSLSNNGTFIYRPSTNYNGTDTFTYRAADGALTSGVATVTITITPVNDAPIAVNDSYSIAEDTTLSIPSLGVLANDIDVDGDPLSALLVTSVSHGTLSLSNNGAFIYRPSTNYNGTDTFTYRATDGSLTSDVATVTITITPVNDAPVALNDNYTIAEDTTLTIPSRGVLANDIDVDGDPLTALLVSTTTHGTLTLSNNGGFIYRPSTNYNGTDTFTYRATDGLLTSDVATVTITITPVNDAPVTVNDFYSVDEDTTLTIPSVGILANDIDVDGDPLTSLLVTNVAHGTLSLSNNGSFIYMPNTNYNGTDTFAYVATDGSLTSGVAIVTITIIPVNDPPTTGTNGDNYSVLEDHTLTVTAPGILGNDGDVDGDPLRALLVSGTAHGTLTLNTNGSFTYVPSANYFGPDSFIYMANDGQTNSLPATVNITVIPVNDAPSFTSGGDRKVNQNAPAQTVPNWASNISAGPTNESDQTLAFVVSNDNISLFSAQPAIAPNGTLTYTPAANVFGVANVHVMLRDNGGTANGGVDTSSEVIFKITVNGPPTINIVSPTNNTAFLNPATFSIITDASDPDGVVTNVQFIANNVVMGNVVQAPFYFVASNLVAGNYALRAIATDNDGLSATSAVVNISVITNVIVATGPIVLNHQNGLFEQFVTVSNRTTETWLNGVRLFVKNLDTTNRVYNPSGTNNGIPYLDKGTSVAPGSSLTIIVQYYVPNDRTLPNPVLVAVPLPFSHPTVVPQITRFSPTAGGTFDLNFTTQSGRFYFIQYTEDFARWTTEPAPLPGTGAIRIAPEINAGGKRFFRVLLIP